MIQGEPSAGNSSEPDARFERIYWAHHRDVLAYCARRLPRSDAWDATAEVFLTAWRRIDDVPANTGTRPWLIGVAHKVVSNQRRGRRRWERLNEKASGTRTVLPSWPEELLIRREEEREVLEMLASLNPKDSEILQLSLWEDLSPSEIASVLGISRAAVDQRYSRARRRAARHLERLYPESKKHATRVMSERGGAT